MNYNIKGKEVQITDGLRTYVERQFGRADKLARQPAHANVELSFDELRDGPKFRAEFTVMCGGKVYRADTWGSTLNEAIDVAGNDLVNELREAKSRRLHVLRHTAVKVKEYLRGWRSKV